MLRSFGFGWLGLWSARTRTKESRPRKKQAARALGRLRSLMLERLEDRTLLSVFTVRNAQDSGTDSLRQAILDANANPGLDTIQFKLPGSGVRTIAPTSAL